MGNRTIKNNPAAQAGRIEIKSDQERSAHIFEDMTEVAQRLGVCLTGTLKFCLYNGIPTRTNSRTKHAQIDVTELNKFFERTGIELDGSGAIRRADHKKYFKDTVNIR